MAKLDKVKEEIGWIKAIFSIVLVTDLSLIAWILQHYDKSKPFLLWGCLGLVTVVTTIVIWLNWSASKKINQLEDL